MKQNVYLDCGGHYGEGLLEFISKYKIDKSWIIETFEPNPACNYTERLSNLDMNLTIHEKAIWTYDGTIKFAQENVQKSGTKSPNDGKSNIDGWASVIQELDSLCLKYSETVIDVPCVDFSKILSKYDKKKYNVIVKFDIEGAEYQIIRHLIKTGTIKNISEFYVEWHHRYLSSESKESTNFLIKQIQSYGIKVYNWK